jgi:hypothetical protein
MEYGILAEVPEEGSSMKHPIVIFVVAVVALAGPATTQPQADDAHHPEKAAKAKKPGNARPQPQKRPAVKPDASKQSGLSNPRV